jgi:hypothetical protein
MAKKRSQGADQKGLVAGGAALGVLVSLRGRCVQTRAFSARKSVFPPCTNHNASTAWDTTILQ